MKKSDTYVAQYQSLRSTFNTLEQLTIYFDKPDEDSFSGLNIAIILSNDDDTRVLHLLFQGVQAIKMELQPYDTVSLCFSIISMKSYQWEYTNYAITEEEQQMSFYCKHFFCEIKEQATSSETETT